MNKTITAFIAASSIALTSGTAFAGYTGPGTTPAAGDVVTINKSPVDDMKVVLSGYITEKTGRETYLFTDGTESIQVEIDSDDFPAVEINAKTRVTIEGEVEAGAMRTTEIEVERLTII